MISVVDSTSTTWQALDFSKLQEELQNWAFSLSSAEEDSRNSRKQLVDLILAFRKSASPDNLKSAAPLLKSFQSEIDSLTLRSKKAEEVFFNVYKRLVDMPDPSIALSIAQQVNKNAERVNDVELENKRLREALDKTRKELASCKSIESDLKKAQHRIFELEETASRNNQDAIDTHLRAFEANFMAKEKEVTDLLVEANRRAAESEAKALSISEALHVSQSQIFDLQSRIDDAQRGKSREMEILLNDLEKANERIAHFEKSKEFSNEHTPKYRTFSETSVHLLTKIEDLESELEKKNVDLDRLLVCINDAETKYTEEISSLRRQFDSTVIQLNNAEQSIVALTNELATKSDYDNIRKELEVLRCIEFPDIVDNSESVIVSEDGSTSAKDSSQGSESLEQRLRRKNEQLQNRIATIVADKEELDVELLNLRQTTVELRGREQRHVDLIARLEDDLNRLSSWSSGDSTERRNSLAFLDERASPFDRCASDVQLTSDPKLIPDTSSLGSLPNKEMSIFSIVQSQRDRFRDRTRELEGNALSLRQQLVAVQGELEEVRNDNLKLFEKIKFVQNYSPASSHVAKPSESQRLPAIPAVSVSVPVHESDFLARYSRAYEDRLNPFTQFGYDERHRRYQALKPYEKVIHGLGRLIINHKGARLAAFAYAMALHVLVFLVLYKMVHTTDPAPPIL